MSSCPGAWYVRACGSFHRNEEGKSVSRLLEEDRRHITVMQNLAAKEPALDSPPKKVEKHRLQVESERRMHEKNRRRILQPGFTDAVEYLGVDIAPEQAMAFASTTAGISLLLMLMVYVILIRTQPGLSSILSRYVLPAVFAVPLLLFSFLASYPEMLAKRVRTASIGRTPEPINYITMSLRTSPSLERAVIFAGEHSGEPMASSLKRVVWDVMLRRHASIED